MDDLKETDAEQVALDCLVLELLLTEVTDELAESGFICKERLDA